MKGVLALAAAAAVLAGCTPVDRDALTRQAAKSVITRVVVARFPNAPVEPVIDCVADNATTGELVGLASDSLTGPTEATTQTVLTIASRTGTIQCLVRRGASPLSLT